MSSTKARLLDRYNSLSHRSTVEDRQTREIAFKSFGRTLGPWLPEDRSSQILDVACGEGTLLALLRHLGYRNLHGFDISPENVRICHRLGFEFVRQCDALNLVEAVGADNFDVIFALDILEHIPKEHAAHFLDQIRSCLRPEGTTIFQTPNMGHIFGYFHYCNDISHEFGLTERSALDLLTIAGFEQHSIEIRPAWNAVTTLGYLREAYLRLLHELVFLAEGSGRPKVPTKNLLIRAHRGN